MCLWGDTITGRGGVSGRAKRTARHHIQTSSSIPGLLRIVWSGGGGGDRGKGGGVGVVGAAAGGWASPYASAPLNAGSKPSALHPNPA